MDSSVFVFGIELVDEGVEEVLGAAVDEGGAGGVSVAVAYHDARDVFPHNPRRTVYFHEGGTVLFPPQSSGRTALRARAARFLDGRDLLGEVTTAAGTAGIGVSAWVVYLHNLRLGSSHPECAIQNVLGDRLITELCPSHPAVREYVLALTQDVVQYPIDSIIAEALHYKSIDHGYHHERAFIELGVLERFLLGVCFCPSCTETAADAGVDTSRVRTVVREAIVASLRGGRAASPRLNRAEVGSLADGGLGAYLHVLSDSVSRLVAEAAAVARSGGASFVFSAHGGSAKSGSTRSADSAVSAWKLGVDLARVGSEVDGLEVLGYVTDSGDLGPLIDGYVDAGKPRRLQVGLRPMWPDTPDPDTLRTRVRIAADRGASRLDFYHYALMPRENLAWIREALSEL